MIDLIVKEIEKSLDNDCYFIALMAALTLPDICGKAEYPNEKSTSKRYKEWYEKYIGCSEYDEFTVENDIPYMSGEIIYNLRNSILHQGNPNIDDDKFNVQHFELLIQHKNEFDIYVGRAGKTIENGKIIRELSISIRRLCLRLYSTARWYFNNNKDKFNFFNYNLVDWDEKIKKSL